MRHGRLGAALSAIALLAGCGGGGGGTGGGGTGIVTPTPTPTPGTSPAPTPAASGCSLVERQNWAAGVIREWYLFPETLPASLDPAGFTSVKAYIDALTATARGQRRDRFFTHIGSIAEESAFFEQGASAGFGIRTMADVPARRAFIAEAFEGAPALAAGIDRGTELLAIGTSSANLRLVSDIIAAEGSAGVTNALGPNTPGTTRVIRFVTAGETREITLTKTAFDLTPVSNRYGAKIINDGGKQVGYLNLRTFISTADPALRSAFAQFRSAGITEVIIDFRYNGGGLVSIAELMGDLLGRNRFGSDVFSFTTFRPEKSGNNETKRFDPKDQSIAPTKIAFIGTSGTASASELVINAMVPYLRANAALVGSNTFGKPVGQSAFDRPQCDDRLRVVTFATQNADRQGNYFDGLARTVNTTCAAADDVLRPLGDPQEASTRAALDFLAGRSCSAIASSGQSSLAVRERGRELLTPDRPSSAQREVPGLF